MLYTDLAGLQVTLQDKNLILPSANETQNATVLCIAPIWTDDGINAAPADEEVSPSYDAVTITKSGDLAANGLGAFTTSNPLAKLWKQATDGGASVVKVIRLHGSTLERRYIGLHNILTVINDFDEFDIVAIGGVYVDDELFAGVTGPTLVAAQRNLLLDAYNADEIVSWSAKSPAQVLSKGTVNGAVAYVFTDALIKLSTITCKVSNVDVAFTAHPANEYSAYPYLTSVTADPASVTVTYDLTTDTAAVDSIDLAASLIRVVSQDILATDIGAGSEKLVVTTGSPASAWELDLTKIDEFTLYDGNGITVTNSNGETILDGVTYAYNISGKSIAFLRSPANWTVSFGVKSSMNFGAQVAAFLENANAKGNACIGVMAVAPIAVPTLVSIKEKVAALPIAQYSKYMQIVAGPRQIFQLNGIIYMDTWQGAYAGMIGAIPSYTSPLNKAIPGVVKQEYALSSLQSLTLSNKHYVVSRKNNTRVVVSDAVTTAEDSSDFTALPTIRIVNDVVALVRDIADPYIGTPNTAAIRAGLETAIKNGLNGMIKAGALSQFGFMIQATTADQLKGDMHIVMEIVPVFNTRKIHIMIAVRPSI